jgi:hypothetical protein
MTDTVLARIAALKTMAAPECGFRRSRPGIPR